MKKLPFFLSILSLTFSSEVFGQVPTHPRYVKQYPIYAITQTPKGFYDFFTAWDENHPKVTEDDNFYISRVPLAERFEDASTQFNPDLTPERKVLWWCPAGISDKYWSSLPRYIFNADAFSSWSMIDIHGNWADGLGRVPGSFSDAAHVNGVQNGCVMFWEREFNEQSDYWKLFIDLSKKDDDGDYYNCRKFIRFLRYYGIDGIGINPEGSTSKIASIIKDVLEQLHRIALEEGWHFRVDWYDSQSNNGSVQYVNGLKASNSEWFQRQNKDYPVSDVFFLNYNWGAGHLQGSEDRAQSLGRSSFDVYAGFDIQGRGLSSDLNQPSDTRGWNLLEQYDISIGIWGAHGKNMLYENSNELGSTALAIQNMYQSKQEQFFYSGTRNLTTAPEITNSVKSYGTKNMEKFHGVTKLTPARSTLNSLPFVTYFNLGNGLKLWNEGEVVFDQQWYNLGSQTILPTWRWWISGKSTEGVSEENNSSNSEAESDPMKLVNAQLSYDKAWKGGSSLRIYGETEYSEIHLFKTQYDLTGDETISLRYHLDNANIHTPESIYLIWSADGKTINRHPFFCKEVVNGNDDLAQAEWVKFESKVSEIGMTGTVKMLGLAVENADKDFDLYVGEFSLTDGKVFNPVTPDIKLFKLLRQAHNAVDFKLIWNSTPLNANNLTTIATSSEARQPWMPVYNNEVDTWYFEVLIQEEGEEPILLKTTTSWASYVVSAPVSDEITTPVRFGVRAVATDGTTRSEIAWTDYVTRQLDQMEIDESVRIDHSNLNPGDEFTISFEDPYHPESIFKVVNASTGETVCESENPTQLITATINEIGVYDVVVGDTKYSSMIYVTPESTGSYPIIESLNVVKDGNADKVPVNGEQELNWNLDDNNNQITTASDAEVESEAEINIDERFAVVMTGRKGEGKVSKGLIIEDPVMLRLSPEMCSEPDFTIAFWVKPTGWAHGRFGTNLLNKRNLGVKWPHNNWGTLWCHIWPETPVCDGLNPNTLSMTQFGNTKANYPEGVFPNGTHEGPNMGCIANDVTMRLDSWYHVAFSVTNDRMSLFVNGKLAGTQEVPWSPNTNNDKEPAKNQYVYIGGSNVYHGGLIGVIDDVQYWDVYTGDPELVGDMMKGYYEREIPEHLLGYWDFEDLEESGESVSENNELKNISKLSTLQNRGHKADLTAQTIYLTSAGGEDTSAAEVVYVEKNNNIIGYPGLEGTYDVVTQTTWNASEQVEKVENIEETNTESNSNNEGENAVSIEYFISSTAGNKAITGTMSNVFGSDSKEVEILVVDQVEGIENASVENSILLQGDKENITLWFAKGGKYNIDIHNAAGKLMLHQNKTIEANTSAEVSLRSKGEVYLISVRDDNSTLVKSWKIMR